MCHENRWHMNIEYLESLRNLPSDCVLFLAMKQDSIKMACQLFVCVDLAALTASAKNDEKVVISRLPSNFEHVTNKSKWHMAYFLCNVQGFPLLWAASAKTLKKLQFRCFSHCSKESFLWFHCAKGTKPSVFRPLPRFPAEFEHVTTYKQMAYGLFSLQFSRFSFALGGFCHFLPFNGFLCNFLSFPLLWAASAKMLKKLQFRCFSHCRKASLLWFHCAKGTKSSFFRPLPRFPAEFEHVTTYKQMAYGLFSLQFSRFSFALGGFCHFLPFNGFLCNFLSFPLLWAASAKNAEKVVLSRFPSDSEHVTNKSRWDMVYFPCTFLLFLCFGRLLPNCWKSRNFHPFNGFLCHFLVLTLRWGAPSGTTAEKVAISMLFPLQESIIFMISLR